MSYLNYEFFDEFKSLDNLCRDIYGKSIDNKLGVTLYLEDMDRNDYQGAFKVSGWKSDYTQLKKVRAIRNELAHSSNSFSYPMCAQGDIDFIRSFRMRIMNQTDPISLLRKQTAQRRTSSTFQPQPPSPVYTHNTLNTKNPASAGCLGIVAMFFIIVAYAISSFV